MRPSAYEGSVISQTYGAETWRETIMGSKTQNGRERIGMTFPFAKSVK